MPLPLLPLALLGGSAAAGALGSALGHRGKLQKQTLLTPEQQSAQNNALNFAQQGLQNPYAGFEPIRQNALNQFQSQFIPSIAERFTSMGNGQRSSGFQAALQQGASGLASNLAGQQAQYGLQNQGLAQNLLGIGMRPSFEYTYKQPESGFLGGALGGLSQGLGALGTAGLGQGLGYFGGQSGMQSLMGNNGGQLQQLLQLLPFLQQLKAQQGY